MDGTDRTVRSLSRAVWVDRRSGSGQMARLGLPMYIATLVRTDGQPSSGKTGLPAHRAVPVCAGGWSGSGQNCPHIVPCGFGHMVGPIRGG